MKLFPSAVDVLTQLGNKGTLVLLSNKGLDAVMDSLNKFSIFNAFDLVLAEETGAPRKPEAAVFETRIRPEFPELTPKRCLVVGDTQADIQFGTNIGAPTAFAAYGYGDKDKCMAMAPTHVLATFAEVLVCM